MDDWIEDRDTGDMEAATSNLERGAQFLLNDGEQNDTRILFNFFEVSCRSVLWYERAANGARRALFLSN